VEVTPDAAMATPEGTRALRARLAALPEVEEVQGGSQWVDGLAQFGACSRAWASPSVRCWRWPPSSP
jgi:cell division protein FtsX